VKEEQIKAFQDLIEGEQNLFKLTTIIKNIENQLLQIADAKLPNPFEIEIGDGRKADGEGGWFVGGFNKIVNNQEKKEEEKKQEAFKDKMSKLKKVDAKL
jgi:hypothetical protein